MSRFSLHTLIYEQNRDSNSPLSNDRASSQGYANVLSQIQNIMSTNHAQELAEMIYQPGSETRIKSLIGLYINRGNLSVQGIDNISTLIDRIYNDMAGLSILTPYMEDPDVEEININGPNSISVQYADRVELIDESFGSIEECINIVKKMARMGGKILDQSSPIGDSFIARGIRMSGIIEPCVDKEIGAVASIRKQRKAIITKENLLTWNTATEEELDFLSLCINHGVSIAIAGATSTGKTSDMAFLLEQVKSKRIVMIEDTREIELTKDEHDRKDVVQMLTKEPPNEITMQDLLKLSMRLHPEVLVPAEMRGEEALTAQEAGRTGHTVLTSLHANNAISAYDRILTMTQMAETRLSEDKLLNNIIEAFPIVVFKSRLADGSRKYMEIFEATGIEDGKVTGNMLYRYILDKYEYIYDNSGVEISRSAIGEHKKEHNISMKLAARLFEGGVPLETIRRFSGDDFLPQERGLY